MKEKKKRTPNLLHFLKNDWAFSPTANKIVIQSIYFTAHFQGGTSPAQAAKEGAEMRF